MISRRTSREPNTPRAALLLCALCAAVCAADWPTWRHDARRSAASPEELPGKLHLLWARDYPPLAPAWPDQPRLRFDVAYEPIAAGGMLFFGSSANDSVTALDAATGAERWRFYADGPVRFAPAFWRGRLYFASDDGCLYCLDAASGKLRWKFRGGPAERLVLGNGRLVNLWVARGAPLVHGGKVYFAAGIWPFEGVFVHALDAETGDVVWTNDGVGSLYIAQPHGSPAFAGVAPQGYLAASGGRLLVPCGRSVPACFDLATGKLLYYRLAANQHRGGFLVAANREFFANGDALFSLADGRLAGTVGRAPVMTDNAVFGADRHALCAFDVSRPDGTNASPARRFPKGKIPRLWNMSCPAAVQIKSGRRLYVGSKGLVQAIDIPKPGGKPRVSWQAKVAGTPAAMLAADGRLVVATIEGRICCFGGAGASTTAADPPSDATAAPRASPAAALARTILETTGVREGYCLMLGLGDGRLAEQLAANSRLRVIALDPDKAKVAAVRRRLDAAGRLGPRIAVRQGDLFALDLPPYVASLVVSEDLEAGGLARGRSFVERLYDKLRPYGGVACLPLDATQHDAMERWLAESNAQGARLRRANGLSLVSREGPLPGAADWTHQYADAAKTGVSRDSRVRLPLGVLWFGGPSHDNVLPRHGHGPSELVVGGRLFIEGPDTMEARDIYTGRVLWRVALPGVGAAYDNVEHHPGANAFGSNYAAAPDGVYVAHGTECVRLDPASGRRLAEFAFPPVAGDRSPRWGFVALYDDILIGGALAPRPEGKPDIYSRVASRWLAALDRHTGKVLWRRRARHGFLHNGIAIGKGKLFCLDRVPEGVARSARWRKSPAARDPGFELLALDVRTGQVLWHTSKNVFGTWLGYSEAHDVVLQAGRASRDMVPQPSKRMIAHDAKNGAVLWDAPHRYQGPCLLHGRTIITQGAAYDLLTGRPRTRRHPLTGDEIPWRFWRNYGCGTALAGLHLLTFRSAAAGYYDLDSDAGTGNFGGFRSGCTSNLIPAGGILNAPDYTRTCRCSYQNQCSLALVHRPEVETWTFNRLDRGHKPIRRMGINLGAPGDRIAPDGTLWLDFPVVGGPSPKLLVTVEPDDVAWFSHQPSRVRGDGLRWVAASGAVGLRSVKLVVWEKLAAWHRRRPTLLSRWRDLPGRPDGAPRRYTVRLHFVEPGGAAPGQRVFGVALQGRTVVEALDVVRRAGGPWRPVALEFKAVEVQGLLTIELRPAPGSQRAEPVLCGFEVVAEE